ncbi:hypothetical protein LCGC14_1152230 [marine sediment metagenome]|uniref:Uncharacterized protein n=1 Tax=marine sediment metagenome TaxID=412755 RepID=A0A0F9PDA9_9ZZZZ
MRKGILDGKSRTPKGKVVDEKKPCDKCGVCRPTEKMNKVITPGGKIKYLCTGCLH